MAEFHGFLIGLSYFPFINEMVHPINAQNEDLLPVTAFKGYERSCRLELSDIDIKMAKRRYQSYVRMTKMDWSNE